MSERSRLLTWCLSSSRKCQLVHQPLWHRLHFPENISQHTITSIDWIYCSWSTTINSCSTFAACCKQTIYGPSHMQIFDCSLWPKLFLWIPFFLLAPFVSHRPLHFLQIHLTLYEVVRCTFQLMIYLFANLF